MNQKCDKVEKTIELRIELEPNECDTEYLLNCEWLPSSETLVATICGTFVKVFDIRRTNPSTPGSGGTDSVAASEESEGDGGSIECVSSTCYTLAYEDALIRSAAVFPLDARADKTTSRKDGGMDLADEETNAKMVLLFDSGRMHCIDITYDSNGDMDEQGEIYIESIDAVTFPTAGIRRYSGAGAGASGSVSSTFGEGQSLTYLVQSGLLLYKCISSCVVALIIDRQSGDITGSFELLPQVLTSSMIGSGIDGYSISSPFIHWTELGVVEKDGAVYYRVACSGKSTRTNQPKAILVEFNASSVRVKELAWSAGSTLGLGLSLNTSFEGFTAFSAPILVQGSQGPTFYERAFLAAVTSKGQCCYLVKSSEVMPLLLMKRRLVAQLMCRRSV